MWCHFQRILGKFKDLEKGGWASNCVSAMAVDAQNDYVFAWWYWKLAALKDTPHFNSNNNYKIWSPPLGSVLMCMGHFCWLFLSWRWKETLVVAVVAFPCRGHALPCWFGQSTPSVGRYPMMMIESQLMWPMVLWSITTILWLILTFHNPILYEYIYIYDN